MNDYDYIYFLVQAGSDYVLYHDDGTCQGFLNNGNWEPSPPSPASDYTNSDEYVDHSERYWWQRRFTNYIDGALVKKFKTLEDYAIWYKEHPELII